MRLLRWWRRLLSDHGDGTDHDWEFSKHGFFWKCRTCAEFGWYDVRID